MELAQHTYQASVGVPLYLVCISLRTAHLSGVSRRSLVFDVYLVVCFRLVLRLLAVVSASYIERDGSSCDLLQLHVRFCIQCFKRLKPSSGPLLGSAIWWLSVALCPLGPTPSCHGTGRCSLLAAP